MARSTQAFSLGIAPAAGGAMAKQAAYELGDQVAAGLIDDKRLQQDCIGSTV